MPSANRKDYKNEEDRVKGYNDALENYKGDDFASFMGKYGHLLDDNDDKIAEHENLGQISEMVKDCGKANVEQLMAIADDDDELDLFINQMKDEKMF